MAAAQQRRQSRGGRAGGRLALAIVVACLAFACSNAQADIGPAAAVPNPRDVLTRLQQLGSGLASLRGTENTGPGSSVPAASKETGKEGGKDKENNGGLGGFLGDLANNLGLDNLIPSSGNILGGDRLRPVVYGGAGDKRPNVGVYGGQRPQDRNSFRALALGTNQVPNQVITRTRAELSFKEVNGTLNGTVTLYNVENFTQAHLHAGNASTNGPIVFWVWSTEILKPSKQPLTAPLLTFPWSVTAAQLVNSTLVPDYQTFLTLLNKGDIYFNVHTTAYPSGIARGQVVRPIIRQ